MDNIFQIKKNILVISRDPRTLAEIKKGLRDSFEIILAPSGDASADALGAHDIDCVLLCLGSGGAEMAAADLISISGLAAGKGIPVLFLAESDDERAERDAFAAYGAADYSVRRKTSDDALTARLNLRIRASENRRLADEKKNGGHGVPAEKIVLIAEDVVLNQEIVDVMFSETEGLSVEFADNGLEAVEKFKKNTEACKLILMDIHMPKMDGISAAKTIRHLGGTAAKNIPIIALTANTGEEDIAGFVAAGMNGYLEKPIDYDKLMEVIRLYVC